MNARTNLQLNLILHMSKQITITKKDWQHAFRKAEAKTVDNFPDHSDALCGAKNKDGDYECPLCYMSIQMKNHLGLENREG